jgi:hypothetical protein
VLYPDIDEGIALVVDDRLVDLFQSIKSFHNLAKYSSFSVQEIRILAQCDDELGSRHARVWVGLQWCCRHADRPSLKVFQLRVKEGGKRSLGRVAG